MKILLLMLSLIKKDRANQLFKQVHVQKSLRGRSNDAIASACLYIACRQDGVPRTFKGFFLISFFFVIPSLYLFSIQYTIRVFNSAQFILNYVQCISELREFEYIPTIWYSLFDKTIATLERFK